MAKRMFVAIDLPEQVTETLGRLDRRLPGLRWLPASQLHLTLCFLAAVPEPHEGSFIGAIGQIRVPPFALTLKGLGSFGRNRQPSVVWAGVESAPPALFMLRRQVCDAALAAGLAPDLKPFHPHVTVGRCKAVAEEALRSLLAEHETSDFGTFEVTGLTLYASVLHPHGPEHSAVFRRTFEKPGPDPPASPG